MTTLSLPNMKDLKIANCGCGGEGELYDSDPDYEHSYLPTQWIKCKECGIATDYYNDETKVINAWNKAMGERTAKVDRDAIFPVTVCGICHSTVAYPNNYCSDCGAKLDWSER